MRIAKTAVLFVCVLALSLCVLAQDVGPPGDESSVAGPAQMPLLKQNSLALVSELERSNYVSAGVSAGTTFDDNALNSSTDHASNLADTLSGHIALAQSLSRLHWNLSYGGGVTVNQNIPIDLQPAHDLSFTGQYRLSPHVSLLVNDDFSRFTGTFNNEAFTGSSGGLIQKPNQFVLLPLSKQTNNSSSVELDYQFARYSKVGVSGNFNMLRFSDVQAGNTPLIDTNSLGADAYYMHRLGSKNWLGVLYRYQKFSFPSRPDRAIVHALLLNDTITLAHHLEITLFAGPEEVSNTAAVTGSPLGPKSPTPITAISTQRNWTFAAGGSFGWNGKRTSIVADGSRTVSDGGGLLGAVQLIGGSGNIRHQFTQYFFAQCGVRYGNSNDINGSANDLSSLRELSAYGSLTRSLRNNVMLTLGYSRDLQQHHLTNGPADINHNRAWASVSYNFTHPIGR
jgi:hypothetical protein